MEKGKTKAANVRNVEKRRQQPNYISFRVLIAYFLTDWLERRSTEGDTVRAIFLYKPSNCIRIYLLDGYIINMAQFHTGAANQSSRAHCARLYKNSCERR